MNARTPGLLLIEGDVDTLKQQGHLRLGDDVQKFVGMSKPEIGMRFLRQQYRTEEDVQRAALLATFARFPAVMLVAHGSPDGVVVARQRYMSWEHLGLTLAPLEPRALIAVCCFGGISKTAETLFRTVPTLNTIVGSPAPISSAQASIAVVEAMVTACHGEIPTEWSTLLYVANAFMSDGVLFRRTREGMSQASPQERAMSDLAGLAAWTLLRDGNDEDLRVRPGATRLSTRKRVHVRQP